MVPSALPPLYLLTNRHQTKSRPLKAVLDQAIRGGARFIQLRERDLDTRALLRLAQEVVSVIRQTESCLLINDRVDLVLAIGAEGVHLRSDSLPVREARRILGPNRLIGVSTHSVQEVLQAEQDGADFTVLGPVYETASKTTYGVPIGLRPLEDACHRCQIPVYAIGGMTASRVEEVKRAGAYGVAVISSILSSENIESATGDFIRALSHKS